MKKNIWLIVLFFISFNLSTAFARQHEIIREHSKIAFDLDYMVMSNVDGSFKIFHGLFDFDEKTKTISNLKVEIKSQSIDTNDEKRDFHLRAQEFLFSEVHPYITFTSQKKVVIKEDNTFELPGTMTLRGISKPIVFQGVYKGSGKDAWGKANFFFTLKGSFDRKDFNMVWNKKLDDGGYLIGDQIRISIVLQTQYIGDKTPFSTHMVPTTKGIIERDMLKKGKIKKLSTSTDPKDHTKSTNGN